MSKEDTVHVYMDKINEWIKVSKTYEDEINFKELAKLSGKEIVKRVSKLRLPEIKDKIYIIKSRNPKYNLQDYYNNPEKYFKDLFTLIYKIQDVIKGYHDINCITFYLPENDKPYYFSVIHYVFNMILWFPLFILDIPVTEDLIFHEKVFDNKSYCNFLNNKIIDAYKHLTTHNEMSLMLAKMYDLFIIISERNGLSLGLSFSLYDLISRWDNQEIYDINHTVVPDNMQIHDAEVMLTQKVNRYKEIMMNTPDDNVLKPLIRSGQGVNTKQLREFAVSIGFKPDPDGYTYAVTPKTSFISDGIRDPLSFVIDSTAGRYAAILALEIDTSGYLQRTLCKAASNIFADPDSNYDCGSVNYYTKTISDKDALHSMRGRWYLTKKNTLRQLIDTDYDMIGQTLQFRSPATCACANDGRGICRICLGHLYEQNKNINLGINSVLRLSEENYQNTMSAKHILDTSTGVFAFNDEFYDYFYIENGFTVCLRDDIEETEHYEILINVNMIKRDREINDLVDNEYISEFDVVNNEENTKVTIKEINGNPIYISNSIIKQVFKKRIDKDYDEEGNIHIPFNSIELDEDIFFTKLKNKEITKPLKDLRKCIEKGKEIEDVNSISEFIDKIFNLFKAGGINAESVHTEVLVRNLIRDKNNIIALPNYRIPNVEYTLTSVHNSILSSDSIITSLTFERLAQQFRDPMTYNKHGTSPLDRLFLRN